MNRQVLNEVLDELERRQRQNALRRRLRDMSDPFEMPEEDFRKYYRLTVEAARHFFLQIQNGLQGTRRRTAVPMVVKYVTALHFFAHGSYQKPVGLDRYNSMSQPNVSKTIHSVVNAILNMVPTYIKFPSTPAEVNAVKEGFFEKFQFPGIIGCIDCTHIYIFPPPANHPEYPGGVFINRKGQHSINCQLICDANRKILAINARYPGSVHDAAIWMSGNVKTVLLNAFRNGERQSWLIGDSGYPLQPFLLTPVVGAAADTPEARCTRRLCTIRNCIERTNGTLKGSFRCIWRDRVLHCKPDFAAKIIYCCAVLHNLKLLWNIEDDDLVDDDDQNEDDYPFNGNIDREFDDNGLLQHGQRIRNNLIQQLFHN